MINNEKILTGKTETGSKGMNVLAVESRTHNVLIKKAYNTSESKKDSRQLARDLKNLPNGTIVMVAVKEDAVGAITTGVYQYFANQGAKEILQLQPNENYVFIGVKGSREQMSEKKGPGVGIGMVLSFSSSVKRQKRRYQATEGGSRIEFESAGFNNGNFASITVENEEVLNRDTAKRGLNVVVLDGRTHKVLMNKAYDTKLSSKESAAMVADSKKVKKGSVVIAVVKDDASKELTNDAKRLFAKMGSVEINNLQH
jgi:hypothetical protein